MTRHVPRLVVFLTVTFTLVTGCGGKGLQARMAHGEEKASDAEAMLDEAQKRLDEKNPDSAERLINDAEKALAHPDVGYYPERDLLTTRVGESRARLDAVRAELAWRAREERIDKQQRAIDEVVAKLKPAMALLKPEALSHDHLDDAEAPAEALQDLLNDGRPLEKSAPRYEQYVQPHWALLMDSAKELKMAAAVLKFQEGPFAQSVEGQKLLAEAKKRPKRERVELYEDAQKAFQTCRVEGNELLAQSPGLDKRALLSAPGKTTQVKTVIQTCVAELTKLEKSISDAQKAAAAAKVAAEKPASKPKPKVPKKTVRKGR